jgi:hypothetical protein
MNIHNFGKDEKMRADGIAVHKPLDRRPNERIIKGQLHVIILPLQPRQMIMTRVIDSGITVCQH